MCVNIIMLNSNPFLESYAQSDLLGKAIFLGLYALSICSWTVLIYKMWMTHQVKKQSFRFYEAFNLQKFNPLTLEGDLLNKKKNPNPFLDLYQVLKKQCLDILTKNRHFRQLQSSNAAPAPSTYLSPNDMDFIAAQLSAKGSQQVNQLEKHLYLLATTVSLAPFLGLLGTVWGILNTFSALQTHGGGNTHQMVLNGLSLALATTVLGLLDAIPALVGYNYLRNSIREFAVEMEAFSNEMLGAVELQYCKVDA